ncbi:transcriptional regulator [Streptomyces sp. NPDC086777]|uniref:transcriptional regulator n=1 Tax=Streptomyces sp. NPDC086777 TaxID=3154866 RepID=UPI00345048A0
MPGDSPRSEGQDQEHIARLAEIEEPLPPILVERRSMRVIDGIHRLFAMLLKGRETIEVEFFDGSTEDAFLHGVKANVTHGLPLSHADRKAAAARIVASHPHLSDRAIARASGLGAKTVAAIRHSADDGPASASVRVGSDGKVRPLNSAEGRLKAAEVLAERPEASLREVARIAGISPATVSDVRKRIAMGELPVAVRTGSADPDLGVRHNRAPKRIEQVDPAPVLKKLLRDPALRHNEEGRNLLRLLQQNAIAMSAELTVAVPPHCRELVVTLARQYAETWNEFARELEGI